MSSTTPVLVTGAGGFIGAHLVAFLHGSGVPVRALDLDLRRLKVLKDFPDDCQISGDIGDPEVRSNALRDIDTVFNLAAAHREVDLSEKDYRRTNVESLAALANSAATEGIRRFVHCSSVGVFGRVTDPPIDEETLCRPRNLYERTKLEGEDVLRKRAIGNGLSVVILRPAWVYGPGCPRTHRLFDSIGRGRFVLAGRGNNHRHCIYVRDMIEGLRLAATVETSGVPTLILGDKTSVTVRDLTEAIARITGSAAPRTVPYWSVALAAGVIEWMADLVRTTPPISTRSLAFFNSNTSFDVTKASRILGFETQYDLDRGLEETWTTLQLGIEPTAVDLADYWSASA